MIAPHPSGPGVPAGTGRALEVTGLHVVRRGRVALADVSFTAPRGQVVGLLGPSGSGKSTLIRAVVGQQRVARGSVRVLGMPAGCAGARRVVGYSTQSGSVYDDLTVAENLRYFAALTGVPAGRAAATAHAVGLDGETGSRVDRLSGGQRARVSLAVALLADPAVVVLDEPTVGLDPMLRETLWKVFRGLAAGGTTLLVSSHVMEDAAWCDRLLLLREGALLADDTPDALLAATGAATMTDAFVALVRGPVSGTAVSGTAASGPAASGPAPCGPAPAGSV